MSARWVVLAAAHPAAAWYREIARWASSAALPLEAVVCTSVAEATVALRSGRRFSCLLADERLHGVERDLLQHAIAAAVPPVVVHSGRERIDWHALGAHAALADSFGADDLLATLRDVARPVDELAAPAAPLPDDPGAASSACDGSLVAVLGGGGTGTSTVARALAEGTGREQRVLLADLALHADQALLHDVGDLLPGLPELLELCRRHEPGDEAVRDLTFSAPHLPHHLLLGLRRHAEWTLVRPGTLARALAWCRAHFALTVADCDDDLEGEADTAAIDVEDRNRLARHAAQNAEVVVLTGRADTAGLHRLVRLLGALAALEVPAGRLQPVLVGTPRHPARRAALVAAVHELATPVAGDRLPPPLLLRAHPGVERAVRDGAALPRALSAPVARQVLDLLGRVGPRGVTAGTPEPVVPGTLGHRDHAWDG